MLEPLVNLEYVYIFDSLELLHRQNVAPR